ASSFSTRRVWFCVTRYCFPPDRTIAYISHSGNGNPPAAGRQIVELGWGTERVMLSDQLTPVNRSRWRNRFGERERAAHVHQPDSGRLSIEAGAVREIDEVAIDPTGGPRRRDQIHFGDQAFDDLAAMEREHLLLDLEHVAGEHLVVLHVQLV